jgi:hypothetical protein
MKRRIPGLAQTAASDSDPPDGLYLVRVERLQYRWSKQKPFYNVRFSVLEPPHLAGTSLSGRLYCTERALWKLSWFLRDFGYDTELLSRDELDEKALIGLKGVVKISTTTLHGRTYLNLDAFAPSGSWDECMVVAPSENREPEVA